MIPYTTPDWTQYSDTYDDYIDRMERRQEKEKCYSCQDKFEYDELEDHICYDCREEAKNEL